MGHYYNTMPRRLFLDFFVFLCTVVHAHSLLQCACTTGDCRAEGAVRCVASSMCYVQFLDRGDGASPWSRGCIDGIANSLLCENQPPAALSAAYGRGRKGRRGKLGGRSETGPPILWPLIHCCSTSFCNSEEFSASYPVWMKKKLGMNSTSSLDSNRYESPIENSYDSNLLANNNDNHRNRNNDHRSGAFNSVDTASDRETPFPSSSDSQDYDPYSFNEPKVLTVPDSGDRSVNPIYVAVPAVGACLLVVIVVFAFYLLRKHGSNGAGGGSGVKNGHRHRGVNGGPVSTPSLLSSSPFLYADRLSHDGGPPDCVCCESSSSSSSLYCHHDERPRDNHAYLQKHPPVSDHPNQKLYPPKYAEAFLHPGGVESSHPLPQSHWVYPANPRQPKTSHVTHASDPTLFASPPLQPPPAYLGTSMAPLPDDTPPAYLGMSAPLPRDVSPAYLAGPTESVPRDGSPPSYVPRAYVATADKKDHVQSLLL